MTGSDDYAMMREVLVRRFKRGRDEEKLPDLLLVDGGKGQVSVAVRAAAEVGVEGVDIIGMAKGDTKSDMIYLPGRSQAVELPAGSGELHLLQRVRDEAHRFAAAYHRKLRGKESLSSPLDGVNGLGALRRRQLLAHFGGARGLKALSVEEIARVPGIGPVLAGRIHSALRGQ